MADNDLTLSRLDRPRETCDIPLRRGPAGRAMPPAGGAGFPPGQAARVAARANVKRRK